MKLAIKDNRVYATMPDDSTAESKYEGCTFMLIPNGKYRIEKTTIDDEGNETTMLCNIDCGDPAPVLDEADELENIRYQRSLDYPALGDVIDAICKAEDGDRTELDAIIEYRKQIKAKYPKP